MDLMYYAGETLKFEDGKNRRILFDTRTALPVYLPFLFFCEKNTHRSFSRQCAVTTAIQSWYAFWQQKYGRTFCASFIDSDYNVQQCIEEIPTFLNFMKDGGIYFDNVAQLTTPIEALNVLPSTLSARLRDVGLFLKYLISRYASSKIMDGDIQDIQRYAQSLRLSLDFEIKELQTMLDNSMKTVSRKKSGSADNDQYKSLDVSQVNALIQVIRPSTAQKPNTLNPRDDSDVQLRNYVMSLLMLRLGLRIGEVRLLEVNSVRPNVSGHGYTLDVRVADDKDFETSVEAELKNQYATREVPLPADLYKLIHIYIEKARFTDKGKTQRPRHRRLFLGGGDQPISYHSVLSFLKDAYDVIKKHFPALCDTENYAGAIPTLTPHMLRHTWANAELAKQVAIFQKRNPNNHRGAVESAKSILRSKGGWSHASRMPDHYGKRFLQDSASNHRLLAYYMKSKWM